VLAVKAGPSFGPLGRNPLGELLKSTPALSDGTIFIRAQHHVFAVGR